MSSVTPQHREFLVHLGRNVRRERNSRGLTQEALAELVDVHPRTIPKIEAGEINLLITTIARIRAALDCPLAELVPIVEIRGRHFVRAKR